MRRRFTAKDRPLTREIAAKLIKYDPETGEFLRRLPDGTLTNAVRVSSKGYGCIHIDGVPRKAHRVAFLLMTGEVPSEVDHINTNKLDNRWCNLRAASRSENMRNLPRRRDSRCLYKGTSFHIRHLKWQARISVGGRDKHLGYFNNPLGAALAYDRAAVEYFGEFARTNFPTTEETINVRDS